MSEQQLIALVGLPRSGKSTWAREYSKQHGIPMVNPDSVRLAIHGERYIQEAEQFVWATVNAMIRALFLAGHSHVILDATNVSRKRRDTLKFCGYPVVFHHIDASAEICRLRAMSESDNSILSVIDRMEFEFEPLGDDESRLLVLGATNRFPRGSIIADDEGELQLSVSADRKNRVVRIKFGTPVAWLGLPADDAKKFASIIVKNAESLG